MSGENGDRHPAVELFKNEGFQMLFGLVVVVGIGGMVPTSCVGGYNERCKVEAAHQAETIRAVYDQPGLTPDEKMEAAAIVRGHSPAEVRRGRPVPPIPVVTAAPAGGVTIRRVQVAR